MLGVEVRLARKTCDQLWPPPAHATMRDQEPIAPDSLAIVRPPPQRGLRDVVIVARDVPHGVRDFSSGPCPPGDA
jgi:hypothetical protein